MGLEQDYTINLHADNKKQGYITNPAEGKISSYDAALNLVNKENIETGDFFEEEEGFETDGAFLNITPAVPEIPAAPVTSDIAPKVKTAELDFAEQIKSKQYIDSLNPKQKQVLLSMLKTFIAESEGALAYYKNSNGHVENAWDGMKNAFGMYYGSAGVQERLDKLKQSIENAEAGKESIADVYVKITGNYINEDEVNRILNHKPGGTDKNGGLFKNSPVIKDVLTYAMGQKEALENSAQIAAAITALAAAPATGGGSIAAYGGAVLAGTGAYTAVKAYNGFTGSGYGLENLMSDLAHGAVTSSFTLAGGAAGRLVSGAGKIVSAGTQGAVTASGINGGNYIADKLLKGEEINSGELKEILMVSGIAGTFAGMAGIKTSDVLGRFMQLDTGTSSAVLKRLLKAGITGGAAGGAGAAGAGGTKYVIEYLKDKNKEFKLNEFLEACCENVPQGVMAGIGTGTVFESVNMLKEHFGPKLEARAARKAAEAKAAADKQELDNYIKDGTGKIKIAPGQKFYNEILNYAKNTGLSVSEIIQLEADCRQLKINAFEVLDFSMQTGKPYSEIVKLSAQNSHITLGQAVRQTYRTPEQTYRELAEYRYPHARLGEQYTGSKYEFDTNSPDFQKYVDFAQRYGLSAEEMSKFLNHPAEHLAIFEQQNPLYPNETSSSYITEYIRNLR